MNKKYIKPTLKVLGIGTLSPLAESGNAKVNLNNVLPDNQEYDSKSFTGGIDFDDDETDSPW